MKVKTWQVFNNITLETRILNTEQMTKVTDYLPLLKIDEEHQLSKYLTVRRLT